MMLEELQHSEDLLKYLQITIFLDIGLQKNK